MLEHLYQLLKRPTVDWFSRHKIANGEIKINNFTIIYLRANEITNVNEDIESTPDKMPLSENTLKSLEDELNVSNKFENEAGVLNMFSFREQINVDTLDVIETTLVQIDSEKFINIAINMAFRINRYGGSIV